MLAGFQAFQYKLLYVQIIQGAALAGYRVPVETLNLVGPQKLLLPGRSQHLEPGPGLKQFGFLG
jgi:hypothetical protein